MTASNPHHDAFTPPSIPHSAGYQNLHRSSLTLSDLYANPPHGESVRSTYRNEWSSRSQTDEQDAEEHAFERPSGAGIPEGRPVDGMADGQVYTSPHQFGYAQGTTPYNLGAFHGSVGRPTPPTHAGYTTRLDAEVAQEIGIANAEGVFTASPHTGSERTGAARPSNFYDPVPMPSVPGFDNVDFTSLPGFDFHSSPTQFDLLQLLASDGSLAFGHTLIPQFHTYTRRNSPVLESGQGELGESAFPGTQLARHPHMEIDVSAWMPDPGASAAGNVQPVASGAGELNLSQFGVSMDIAHFWSSLMAHGHAPTEHVGAEHELHGMEAFANSAFAGPSKASVAAPESIKQDAKRSLSAESPLLAGSSGRPQEAINEARCLITDLVGTPLPAFNGPLIAHPAVVQLERINVSVILELSRPLLDVVLYQVPTDVQRDPPTVVFRQAGAGAIADQYDCVGEFVRTGTGCQGKGKSSIGRGCSALTGVRARRCGDLFTRALGQA